MWACAVFTAIFANTKRRKSIATPVKISLLFLSKLIFILTATKD